MLLRSTLVISALLVGGAVPFLASSRSPAAPAAAAEQVHGQTSGVWELPNLSAPGHVHGEMHDGDGHPLFEVQALVMNGSPSQQSGALKGVVRSIDPNPGPIGELRGHWRIGLGGGRFSGAIVRPESTSGAGDSRVVGRIRGVFSDPNGPLPPAGTFHGVWYVDL